MSREPIPLTVLGGYLGAGKTTLINHLLRHNGGRRIAVLVNDFGDLAIDADLIERRDEDMISIAGGCVCCSFGSDMMDALRDLADGPAAYDHVLLEASGVALPMQVAQSATLLSDYRLDVIVTLVDAETCVDLLGRDYVADTVAAQIKAADLIILNKSDLASAAERERARAQVALLAPDARVLEAERAALPPEVVLGVDGRSRPLLDLGRLTPHLDHHQAVAVEVKSTVDPTALAEALAAPGLDIVRAKGVVRGHDGAIYAIQAVGRRSEARQIRPPGDPRFGLVCIRHGRRIEPGEVEAILRAVTRDQDCTP